MIILNHQDIKLKTDRLAYAILEETHSDEQVVFAGIEPRGVILTERLKHIFSNVSGIEPEIVRISHEISDKGVINVHLNPGAEMLSGKTVILIDDVLNSGRTMAAALAEIMKYPVRRVKTVVLVDRDHKDFPLKADIVGLSLSTNLKDHVSVEFGSEDKAVLR